MRLPPKDFFALYNMTNEFILYTETVNRRSIAGLRGVLAAQVRPLIALLYFFKQILFVY